MSERRPARRALAARAASALLALAILLSLRLPTNRVEILNVDEADFVVESSSLLDGGRPYIDFVEKKPPLLYVLYAGGLGLVGRYNLPGLRLLMIGYELLTALVVAAIAGRFYGSRAALLAAPMYALISSVGLPMDVHAANAETLFLLPLVAGTWLSLSASPVRSFPSGFMLALGSLIKQQAGMQIAIVAFAGLALRDRFRRLTLLSAGFLAAWVLALGALAAIGALQAFRFWTIDINRYYIANGNGWRDGLSHFILSTYSLYSFAPLLWILAFGRAVYELVFAGARRLLVLSWLVGSLLPIALGGRFFPHYFLQLYPPMVLLASAAAVGLWKMSVRYSFSRALVGTAALVLFVYQPAYGGMSHLRNPEQLSIPHATPAARAIAAWVQDHTAPDDRVVFWGYGSALYYLSQRRPATRFPYVTYLVGAVEGTPAWWSPFRNSRALEIPEAWDLFFEDLDRHPPAIFIDTAKTGYFAFYKFPPRKYPRLDAWLEAGYTETEVDGFPVWTRKEQTAATP